MSSPGTVAFVNMEMARMNNIGKSRPLEIGSRVRVLMDGPYLMCAGKVVEVSADVVNKTTYVDVVLDTSKERVGFDRSFIETV